VNLFYQSVVLGVELCRDVGGVADHADAHGPLGRQEFDHSGREKHAREDQGHVDGGQRISAEASILST